MVLQRIVTEAANAPSGHEGLPPESRVDDNGRNQEALSRGAASLEPMTLSPEDASIMSRSVGKRSCSTQDAGRFIAALRGLTSIGSAMVQNLRVQAFSPTCWSMSRTSPAAMSPGRSRWHNGSRENLPITH